MTYIRFKIGDEVTVITPGLGANIDKYEHLVVERLANSSSRVVLSDGSAWRQDGCRWGARVYSSRYNQHLVDYKTGLEHEHEQARTSRIRSYQKRFDDLIAQLATTHIESATDRRLKLVIAEEVISFLRDMGEEDL